MSPLLVSSFTWTSAGAVRLTAGDCGSRRGFLSCIASRRVIARALRMRRKSTPRKKRKGRGEESPRPFGVPWTLLAVVSLDRPDPDVAEAGGVAVVLQTDRALAVVGGFLRD